MRMGPLVVARECADTSNIHLQISLELANACNVPSKHSLEYLIPVTPEQTEDRAVKRVKQEVGQLDKPCVWFENPISSWDSTGHQLSSNAVIAMRTQTKDYDCKV